MTIPTGTTTGLPAKPGTAILKRIDIGLTTGIIAVLVAFLSLLVSHANTKMALEAQKASVLPIIAIDMGYENVGDRSNAAYVVRLTNVGAGLAHVQNVTPTQHGEPIADIGAFDAAIMNGRMRGNVGYPATSGATGFIRAGGQIEPRRYRMAAAGSELGAYLRGEYGTPLDGMDLEVCYCSVFKDCWTVEYQNRKLPTPVENCGIKDATVDYFQTYIDQTAANRLGK